MAVIAQRIFKIHFFEITNYHNEINSDESKGRKNIGIGWIKKMRKMMRHCAGISTDELSQTSRLVYTSLFCQEDHDSQGIMVSTWLRYEDTMNQQYKSQFMY